MMGEMLSVSPVALRLTVQATACLALGLTGSYLLRHRAARAHQVLFLGIVSAVALPVSHLMVGHLGIGVLAPQDATSAPGTDVSWTVGTTVSETLSTVMLAHTSLQPQSPEVAMPGPVRAVSVYPMNTPRVSVRRVLFTGWAATSCVLLAHLLVRFALGLRVLATSRKLSSQRLRTAITLAKTKVGIESSACLL